MSLTLYFLRHGETIYSRTGGYCGTLDPELTEAGLQMAQAFADTYRTLPWTSVYVSPMKRTIATGKPLCDALGIEMQLRDGLKEIAYGEWEGKTNEDVKQHDSDTYMRWMTEPAWNSPPGGETAVEIASRASLVIAEVEGKYTEGNVLIVSRTRQRFGLCCAVCWELTWGVTAIAWICLRPR